MSNNINDLMEQAKNMQTKMQEVQKELEQTSVQGSAGGNMVTITLTGRYEIKKIYLDDDLLADEKSVIQDLIAAAFNDAVQKIEQTTRGKMSDLTKDMNLPENE
jgi:DNA-binding YbaB/EbfC family protein